MSVIKVSNACKEFRSKSDVKTVLKDFQMNVAEGTIYAMMGSSGCGKTTLISCLVGIASLDSGDIEIFGEPPRRNKSRIGYMPQETALIPEFSIREMLWFFGTIFAMSPEKIEKRIRFLSNLLELPNDDKLVRECSGGQQRRVSFALTLVHEPKILILDEPTVGVDPLLRTKIWDYLLEITSKNNVTVLLSTHYIEEARQSTHIGLMRNGVQIAEDTPQNILLKLEASNLEEAFLKLSERQEEDSSNQNVTGHLEMKATQGGEESKSNNRYTPKRYQTNAENVNQQSAFKIVYALLMKNMIQILRNIDMIVISIIIPILGCVTLHYGIGGEIKGIKLGIVNHEVTFNDECFNNSLVTSEIRGYDCFLHKVSCRFIQEFDENVAEKKFYKNFDDAYQDTHAGIITGFIQLSSNFTKSLAFFNDDFEKYHSDDGVIQVFLDQSDLQVTSLIQRKLYEAYKNFIERLMTDCGKSKKAGDIPIVFEAAHGEIDSDYRSTIVPGFIVVAYFTIASYISSLSMITSRLGGTWNRSLVAGAKPLHFLWSHFIEGLIIVLIQLIEYVCYTLFFFAPNLSLSASILLPLMLINIGLVGLTFGLLLSSAMDTIMESFLTSQFVVYPVSFISGVMWPFEALPIYLQYVGKSFPFAYPIIAFRNILVKDSTICDPSVYMAFLVTSVWIVVQLALSCWFVRDKAKRKVKDSK